MPITITVEPPRQPDIEALLRSSTAFAESLYPPESNFLLSIDALETSAVTFYVARDDAGDASGIAALVELTPDTAEVKRMFVCDSARGQGVATAMLDRLEADARIRGIRRLVLETGPLHTGALALYRRSGYLPIPQFGAYVGEEFSVCFGKELAA